MSGKIEVLSAGPGVTIQDRGRHGFLRYGLTAGGVMDDYAFAEGIALLGNDPDAAAIELFEFGGRFRAINGPVVFALTGAAMRAAIGGNPVPWRTTCRLEPGEMLEIRGTTGDGTYSYLHIGGGIEVPPVMGSRATHLRAKIGGLSGRALQAGDFLPTGTGVPPETGLTLPEPDYFGVRTIRACLGVQSHLFREDQVARFFDTEFTVSNKRDRMGVRLHAGETSFAPDIGLGLISESVVVGDVQVTGDGMPTVLLADRQPTGGYPRIATIITADICAMAQLTAGARFKFCLVDLDEAITALQRRRAAITALPKRIMPLIRDPQTIPDLLSYQLISGVVSGAA